MAWISFPLFLLMISASSEHDIPGPLCAFSAKRLCQSLVTWFRDRTNRRDVERIQGGKMSLRLRRRRGCDNMYVPKEEREGKKHDISLTLTVFLLLVLYIIDYLLFICKETLTEWTWSKYISCLDKKNCHLQGSIQVRQILEWFFVRRDYDKLPAAALLGRKRTLLALANPFYWFTVNIAICQRHLGKGRRRVEKRCVEKLSS